MNNADLDRERLYRITERLALSCGEKPPTEAQRIRAEREVQQDMKRIELDEVVKDWNV